MWKEENNMLQAEFKLRDFKQAWAFMTEVAFHAEEQNHHPNWSNVYNMVNISLTTHDAGNMVTEKDRRLSETISKIFDRYSI